MLLVVDIGNTETVLGLYSEKELSACWRMSSKDRRTTDEVWIMLKMWCESAGYDLSSINGIVISSVVPSLTGVFQKVSEQRLEIKPILVSDQTPTGIAIQYDPPQAVGADRICNSVAGFVKYGGPIIILDFGTATTFDVISETGVYLGGAITLGLASSTFELHRISAKLPHVEARFPQSVIGRSTETSIQSGIMYGIVDLVDGMVDRIQKEMNWPDVRVIATGGEAIKIAEHSKRIQNIEPHLTLEGMKMIYQKLIQEDKEV